MAIAKTNHTANIVNIVRVAVSPPTALTVHAAIVVCVGLSLTRTHLLKLTEEHVLCRACTSEIGTFEWIKPNIASASL